MSLGGSRRSNRCTAVGLQSNEHLDTAVRYTSIRAPRPVNEALKFFAEGMVSIVNIAAPSFQKVTPLPPVAYHVLVAHDLRCGFEKAIHETQNKSREAPEPELHGDTRLGENGGAGAGASDS